jgi:hypothetical protein
MKRAIKDTRMLSHQVTKVMPEIEMNCRNRYIYVEGTREGAGG